MARRKPGGLIRRVGKGRKPVQRAGIGEYAVGRGGGGWFFG